MDLPFMKPPLYPESLDTIAQKHQTDKASVFSRTYAKPHDYCRHLESFFAPMRDRPIKFLEIGIGGGESARTWLEYFPNAQVCGVDLVHDTNPFNTPGSKEIPRYTFCQGNQSDPVFWACFVATYGGGWNVIVDDGSHISGDIITTFKCLWPHVAPGGLYEIEDLDAAPEAVGFLLAKVPSLKLTSDVDSIHFSQELCILKKR
jgi:hypothetical protein